MIEAGLLEGSSEGGVDAGKGASNDDMRISGEGHVEYDVYEY